MILAISFKNVFNINLNLLFLLKMSSIRSFSYSNDEDIRLCHIYLDVSQNPIIGINQTKDRFWVRVEDQFHACEPFKSNIRPRRSLESRISAIQKACAKLLGCINQIQNRNPSGASEQDVVSVYYYCLF